MKHRLLPDKSCVELDQLSDKEKGGEGIAILVAAMDRLLDVEDGREVLNIIDAARGEIIKMYDWAESAAHDYHRFDGALIGIARSRLNELQSPES